MKKDHINKCYKIIKFIDNFKGDLDSILDIIENMFPELDFILYEHIEDKTCYIKTDAISRKGKFKYSIGFYKNLDLNIYFIKCVETNHWIWNYMNDPYGWEDYPKSIIIKANTKDKAIWKLYEYIVKKYSYHLPDNNIKKYDTYGFYILFHADLYYGTFDSYNLDKTTKEHFIKEFKSQVEKNKDFFSLTLYNIDIDL